MASAVTKSSLTLGGLGTTVLRQGDNDSKGMWGGKVLQGTSGRPVADLQTALVSVGVLKGKPDGHFGHLTAQALQRFQWYIENMQYRLRIPAGARAQGGSIVSFQGRALGSRGTCSAALANELLLWTQGGFVTTTPIVRLSISKLSNVELSDGFKLLDYPSAADGEVLVHADFADFISSSVNDQAKKCKVTVLITQTFRREDVAPSGAVVTPAKKSQHLVGHAVDLNIQDGDTINTSYMFGAGKETDAADSFVDGMKAIDGVRWGGDFSPVDYVHFDDDLDPKSEDYAMTLFFAQTSFHASHPMRLLS